MKTVIVLCLLISISSATSNRWEVNPAYEVDDLHEVRFKVAFEPQNLSLLESTLDQVSDIDSPLYGKYLTNDQIADLISLPTESIEEVEKYLSANSGKFCDVDLHLSIHRDYLYVSTCAAQAKIIFPNLSLGIFEKDGHQILRSQILMDVAENLSLLGIPQRLHHLISGIHGITDLPIQNLRPSVNVTQDWLPDTLELTIKDMITRFGITTEGIRNSTFTMDNGQVRQGVVELADAQFSTFEVAQYQKTYGLPINPVKKIFGVAEDNDAFVSTGIQNVEATLDFETITGISGNVETWDFSFSELVPWVDILEFIGAQEGAPKVISVSWTHTQSQYTQSQLDATNTGFMKFGLAGFTWVEAAGDWGPCLGPECSSYDTPYPSSSPYVLCIGGAKVNKNTLVEQAWFHSSGGFSYRIDRPEYQKSHVSKYLAQDSLPPSPKGRYSTSGRAIPDVSAFAAYQPLLFNEVTFPESGTSAATPQVAAMLALINLYRFQEGKGPVGFVNPTLYKAESIGVDITEGQSYATSPLGNCNASYEPGFKAAPGWDPVTGLGRISFKALLQLFTEQK